MHSRFTLALCVALSLSVTGADPGVEPIAVKETTKPVAKSTTTPQSVAAKTSTPAANAQTSLPLRSSTTTSPQQQPTVHSSSNPILRPPASLLQEAVKKLGVVDNATRASPQKTAAGVLRPTKKSSGTQQSSGPVQSQTPTRSTTRSVQETASKPTANGSSAVNVFGSVGSTVESAPRANPSQVILPQSMAGQSRAIEPVRSSTAASLSNSRGTPLQESQIRKAQAPAAVSTARVTEPNGVAARSPTSTSSSPTSPSPINHSQPASILAQPHPSIASSTSSGPAPAQPPPLTANKSLASSQPYALTLNEQLARQPPQKLTIQTAANVIGAFRPKTNIAAGNDATPSASRVTRSSARTGTAQPLVREPSGDPPGSGNGYQGSGNQGGGGAGGHGAGGGGGGGGGGDSPSTPSSHAPSSPLTDLTRTPPHESSPEPSSPNAQYRMPEPRGDAIETISKKLAAAGEAQTLSNAEQDHLRRMQSMMTARQPERAAQWQSKLDALHRSGASDDAKFKAMKSQYSSWHNQDKKSEKLMKGGQTDAEVEAGYQKSLSRSSAYHRNQAIGTDAAADERRETERLREQAKRDAEIAKVMETDPEKAAKMQSATDRRRETKEILRDTAPEEREETAKARKAEYSLQRSRDIQRQKDEERGLNPDDSTLIAERQARRDRHVETRNTTDPAEKARRQKEVRDRAQEGWKARAPERKQVKKDARLTKKQQQEEARRLAKEGVRPSRESPESPSDSESDDHRPETSNAPLTRATQAAATRQAEQPATSTFAAPHSSDDDSDSVRPPGSRRQQAQQAINPARPAGTVADLTTAETQPPGSASQPVWQESHPHDARLAELHDQITVDTRNMTPAELAARKAAITEESKLRMQRRYHEGQVMNDHFNQQRIDATPEQQLEVEMRRREAQSALTSSRHLEDKERKRTRDLAARGETRDPAEVEIADRRRQTQADSKARKKQGIVLDSEQQKRDANAVQNARKKEKLWEKRRKDVEEGRMTQEKYDSLVERNKNLTQTREALADATPEDRAKIVADAKAASRVRDLNKAREERGVEPGTEKWDRLQTFQERQKASRAVQDPVEKAKLAKGYKSQNYEERYRPGRLQATQERRTAREADQQFLAEMGQSQATETPRRRARARQSTESPEQSSERSTASESESQHTSGSSSGDDLPPGSVTQIPNLPRDQRRPGLRSATSLAKPTAPVDEDTTMESPVDSSPEPPVQSQTRRRAFGQGPSQRVPPSSQPQQQTGFTAVNSREANARRRQTQRDAGLRVQIPDNPGYSRVHVAEDDLYNVSHDSKDTTPAASQQSSPESPSPAPESSQQATARASRAAARAQTQAQTSSDVQTTISPAATASANRPTRSTAGQRQLPLGMQRTDAVLTPSGGVTRAGAAAAAEQQTLTRTRRQPQQDATAITDTPAQPRKRARTQRQDEDAPGPAAKRRRGDTGTVPVDSPEQSPLDSTMESPGFGGGDTGFSPSHEHQPTSSPSGSSSSEAPGALPQQGSFTDLIAAANAAARESPPRLTQPPLRSPAATSAMPFAQPAQPPSIQHQQAQDAQDLLSLSNPVYYNRPSATSGPISSGSSYNFVPTGSSRQMITAPRQTMSSDGRYSVVPPPPISNTPMITQPQSLDVLADAAQIVRTGSTVPQGQPGAAFRPPPLSELFHDRPDVLASLSGPQPMQGNTGFLGPAGSGQASRARPPRNDASDGEEEMQWERAS